uniref:Uncharacterized protein n=1 Tax=Arundo donax TaxID=35708 RepID=A0A0A9AB16_ARUDO
MNLGPLMTSISIFASSRMKQRNINSWIMQAFRYKIQKETRRKGTSRCC